MRSLPRTSGAIWTAWSRAEGSDLVGRISHAFNVLSAGLFATEMAMRHPSACPEGSRGAGRRGWLPVDGQLSGMLEAALLTTRVIRPGRLPDCCPCTMAMTLPDHAVLMRAYAPPNATRTRERGGLAGCPSGLAYAEFNIDEA